MRTTLLVSLCLLVLVVASVVPVAGAQKPEKPFAVRLVYFDPAESGLDAKATFGADYFVSDALRISVDYWKQSEDGYSLTITPLTVSWLSRSKQVPGAAQTHPPYFGGGVGWYRVTAEIPGESATESDIGFHILAGMDVSDRAFAEVRYATAEVAGLKAGGFGLSVGYRF